MANEKHARTGMEMLLIPLVKSLGLEPDQLKAFLMDIGGKVTTFDERMARLESQQLEILALLKNERKNDDG